MNVSSEYLSDGICELKKALLVYTNSRGTVFCTIHQIQNKHGEKVIKEGVAVKGENLAELFDLLGRTPREELSKMCWKNERLLAEGAGKMLWYAPAQRREIFFSCSNKKLMQISGKEFPFPALLFLADKENLSVFLLRSSRRPDMKTALYEAPFWNVSKAGRICLPTGARNTFHTMEEWEDIFYKSAFSHSGGASFKTGTVETIFPQLVKEKNAKFPVKNCFRHKFTVGDLLERKKHEKTSL